MILAFILILASFTNSQSVYQLGNVTLTFFSTTALHPIEDTHSQYYPNDYYVDTYIGTKFIYTLSSSSIVQIYRTADPSISFQNFTYYLTNNNEGLIFTRLSANTE